MTWSRVALGLVAVGALPEPARAFSDPTAYAAPVLEGGGGGRFYTGSPADGFGCDSCHEGGEEPEVEVSGLPSRYVGDATYELQVKWPRKLEHMFAVIELTDERGRGAGSIALPPADAYDDDELCEPVDHGVLAAQLLTAEHGRTIVATSDCGARITRLQWTAPDAETGPVWVAGAVVASNHDGDVTGDGVTSFAQPIPAFGTTLSSEVATGQCSATDRDVAARTRAGFALWLALGLAAFVIMRARRRRAVRALAALGIWAASLLACGPQGTGTDPPDPYMLTRGRAVSPWDGGVTAVPFDASMTAKDAATDEPPDADGGGEPDGPPTQLSVSVTTRSQGGRYTPKNIGAIWIEDDSGAWVKTLAFWAGVRQRYLGAYLAANTTRDRTDAVTSATLRQHEAHEVSWDLRDLDGELVPDGIYHVQIEVTDRDGPGELLSLEVIKSGEHELQMPDGGPFFEDLALRLE